MKDNGILLVRILLLSTSQINIYRHTTDKKVRSRIVGRIFGAFCLYAMLMGYSVAICIGYGKAGIAGSVPVMCALVISLLAFVFTFLKTNGYLFNFREYDMLMSLPFESSAVAAAKFLYMYVKSMPWYISISLAMMIGYGIYMQPPVYIYPLWFILSLILPVIPMLAAAFLGFLIARISTGFKKNNLIQTILTFAFIIFCFSLRYIIDALFREDKVQETLENLSDMTEQAARIYMPAGWFSSAVTGPDPLAILLLAGVSIVLFMIVFRIVGRSYRSINSALKSHAAAKNYRMTAQKKRSVIQAVAFKEYRRLIGSTTYLVNGALGEVLAVLLGIATLIFGFERIIETVTHGAPLDSEMLGPAIPFIVYFFVGMMSTTACSPSLEGRYYWIIKSLPIDPRDLYRGKMLFNMYLTLPVMAFCTLCMSISAGADPISIVLYLILGAVLCAFSTAWGCVCGIRHIRLEWENEIEAIKQNTAVVVYMLPNMFVVMGLIVLVVFLGTRIDQKLVCAVMILISAILAFLSYRRAMSLAQKM